MLSDRAVNGLRELRHLGFLHFAVLGSNGGQITPSPNGKPATSDTNGQITPSPNGKPATSDTNGQITPSPNGKPATSGTNGQITPSPNGKPATSGTNGQITPSPNGKPATSDTNGQITPSPNGKPATSGTNGQITPSLNGGMVSPSPNGENSVYGEPDLGIGPDPVRRALDIVVALTILTLVWPLFLALVLATRVSTGGSAIYRQIRVGQGGAPFTLFKFRTMRAWMTGPEVTAPGDDRVTRLGTLLRRAKIDELPQLVNVLVGHMTLVGPRPETVALAVRYPADLKVIFRHRPGVTGPGQVLVGDENIEDGVADVENFYLTEFVPRRVAMDLDYLNSPTFGRTIRWLVDTVFYMAPGAALRSDQALQSARTEPVALD